MKRAIWKSDGVLNVVRIGTTTNKKIVANPKEEIVQTYHFSREQFELLDETMFGLKDFFSQTESNCMSCPLKEYGKCYTHKFSQARGFISMIKSIKKEYPSWDDLPVMDSFLVRKLVSKSAGKYIRFGSYGCPTNIPKIVVGSMAYASKSHTGYTHEWRDPSKQWARDFFMASTHTTTETTIANAGGWRVFQSSNENYHDLVKCPASAEAGFKSSCDKCGLCSGTEGKGSKSIHILKH